MIRRFVERHPIWSLVIAIFVAVVPWLLFAVWPEGLEEAIGRKRVFVNALFKGVTLGALRPRGVGLHADIRTDAT